MCSICLMSFGVVCLLNAYGYYLINKKIEKMNDTIKQLNDILWISKSEYFKDDKFENTFIPKEEYYNSKKI